MLKLSYLKFPFLFTTFFTLSVIHLPTPSPIAIFIYRRHPGKFPRRLHFHPLPFIPPHDPKRHPNLPPTNLFLTPTTFTMTKPSHLFSFTIPHLLPIYISRRFLPMLLWDFFAFLMIFITSPDEDASHVLPFLFSSPSNASTPQNPRYADDPTFQPNSLPFPQFFPIL